MAERIQIQCINKSDRTNPHERITHVGGVRQGERWKLPEDDAVKAIESKQVEFFVSEQGFTADVVVAERHGKKYLKTKPDGEQPDNLLKLPECPGGLLRNPAVLASLVFPDKPVVPNKPGGFA